MSLYTLSDPHLALSEREKAMDIFKGWQDYTERLAENWSRLVTDRDTVVIPGDISWAMRPEDAVEDFAFLNELPGQKIIGKGNHDYWWCTMNKMNRFLADNHFDTIRFLFNNAFEADGFAIAGTRGWFFDDGTPDAAKIIRREAMRLRQSIEQALTLGGTLRVFLHYPAVLDGSVCEEIFSVLKEYSVERCYFGHVHGNRNGRYADFEADGIRFSLVSADFLAFCPKKVF